MSARPARVRPVDLDSLAPDQQAVADRIAATRGGVAGPFAVLLHAPALTDRLQEVGAYLRFETSIDQDLAEVAVLVTARTAGSPFEWRAHEPHARAAGVPGNVIDTIRTGGPAEQLPPRYRAVVDYARCIATDGHATDTAYASALALLGVQGIVEMTVLVGYYALLAMTMAAHEVDAPAARAEFASAAREGNAPSA